MNKRIFPAFSLALFILISALLLLFLVITAMITNRGYEEMMAASYGQKQDPPLTVIIDPGHGGTDPGAVANGIREKDINLAIAFKLRDMFALSGINTVMTREDDVMLGSSGASSKKQADLESRLEFTEKYDNCIFVSIHQNKFSMSKVHGAQTFYGIKNETSKLLALMVQSECASNADIGNKRIIKPGKDIFILENAACPAILLECGFLSNPDDVSLLSTEEYQTKLAFSVFKAITDHYGAKK